MRYIVSLMHEGSTHRSHEDDTQEGAMSYVQEWLPVIRGNPELQILVEYAESREF